MVAITLLMLFSILSRCWVWCECTRCWWWGAKRKRRLGIGNSNLYYCRTENLISGFQLTRLIIIMITVTIIELGGWINVWVNEWMVNLAPFSCLDKGLCVIGYNRNLAGGIWWCHKNCRYIMSCVSVFCKAGRKKKFMTLLSNVHSFPLILSIESLPTAATFLAVGLTNVSRDSADLMLTKVTNSYFKETRTH